jgi:hypothetical protein
LVLVVLAVFWWFFGLFSHQCVLVASFVQEVALKVSENATATQPMLDQAPDKTRCGEL